MYSQLFRLLCVTFLAGGFHTVLYAIPFRPEKCPAAAQIKSEGLSYAEVGFQGYTVAQFSDYGTNDAWLFGFTSIPAMSSQQALNVGHQRLSTLFGAPKPTIARSNNAWTCLYQTSNGFYGIAVTPPPIHMGAGMIDQYDTV